MDLSIVIPIYNEEENIPLLYGEIKEALSYIDRQYEIIFIDDGSKDRSVELLEGLQEQDEQVVVVAFRKNFGQTAAMSAGFDYAQGDICVTMDGDLQNDPHDIPALIQKMEEGYDVVTGWRFDRKDPYLSRKLPSQMANRLISWITGVKLHDYGEMHRFIPAIASGMGISFTEIKVNHRARQFGTSKYGISRTLRVVLDLITVKFLLSYATRPLHVFGGVGFLSSSLGFIMALVMTFQRQFFGIPLGSRPLLLLSILLIFIGIQFITIGLVAELVVRTYHESQNKPIYHVRKVLGRDEGTATTG